jgi:alkylation response protein AidB-like acyl-CoA dehydrogenase
LRCVALRSAAGVGEELRLEQCARDARILDIVECTQQFQLLIIARTLRGKTSAELR